MTSGVTIRQATLADVETLVDLRLDLSAKLAM